jgi:hypothetical protein
MGRQPYLMVDVFNKNIPIHRWQMGRQPDGDCLPEAYCGHPGGPQYLYRHCGNNVALEGLPFASGAVLV